MIPTFSGSGKKARNVNLSGRINSNPFAKASSGYGAPATQSTVAAAQQDRQARQRERERIQAASRIQRSWRRYARESLRKKVLRRAWDEREEKCLERKAEILARGREDPEHRFWPPRYGSEEEAWGQMDLLLEFADFSRHEDIRRLLWKSSRGLSGPIRNDDQMATMLALAKKLLSALALKVILREDRPSASLELNPALEPLIDFEARVATPGTREDKQGLLHVLQKILRNDMSRGMPHLCPRYYRTLASLAPEPTLLSDRAIWQPLTEHLCGSRAALGAAYAALAKYILVIPDLRHILGTSAPHEGFQSCFDNLISLMKAPMLSAELYSWLQRVPSSLDYTKKLDDIDTKGRLALLTHLIYCYRINKSQEVRETYAADPHYVFVVGRLLSSLVDDVQLESTALSDNEAELGEAGKVVPDEFQREQIMSLVDQKSVEGIVAQMGSQQHAMVMDVDTAENGDNKRSLETRELASYVLTLLRMFPRRGDDIRMWLYLGLAQRPQGGQVSNKLDVISYFWSAAARTTVFNEICNHPNRVVHYIQAPSSSPGQRKRTSSDMVIDGDSRDQGIAKNEYDAQWRIILILMELYTFVLKVMDDEEFFSNNMQTSISGRTSQKNALSLRDLQSLTTFLKHLGFTLYYKAAELSDIPDEPESHDLGRLFRINQGEATDVKPERINKPATRYVAGVPGMTLDYVKGLVTGLLRAIYERDSRRPFLPTGHWLMTSQFDMTHFIDAVVEEEERRHKVQVADDEDKSDDSDEEMEAPTRSLIGTSHAQRTRRLEQLQRQQRKASRGRYLQAVAPRLEILQNMPFIIPFKTRVLIFRRFIYMDQVKSRGAIDADFMNMLNPGSGRHQAQIRREHEFEDAYEQFYNLGSALKQPISITFVDRFDAPEAGIDGGGVTKEFLTTVTGQAFKPNNDSINMFSENDQHLMFPNPSALDEQKELLRQAGLKPGDEEWTIAIQDLLQKYEFLGRIIGKCLYENILVDVGFAGFFLLKWALTGGAGQAPKESGYRASLNDLRDFDEGLYQGLVSCSCFTIVSIS